MAAEADPRHFVDGKWNYDNGLQMIHHLGGDRFSVSQQVITAKKG